MKKLLLSLVVTLLPGLLAAGCCSGSLVVNAFEKGNGEPVYDFEVRVEEAGRHARGERSVRLNDLPCQAEHYLVHVSSPPGYFRQVWTKAKISDGRVVSLEVEVELNEQGVAAKERKKKGVIRNAIDDVTDLIPGGK